LTPTAAVRPISSRRAAELQRLAGLIRIAAMRSLKVRYRGSAVGILWSFSNPLLMTLMYTVVFGAAFLQYFDHSIVRYLVYVFVGLSVVTFFLNATSDALLTVVTNGALLNKIALPPAVFPLASVAANLFQQLCTTFPVVFIISIVVTHDPVRVVLVPVVLAGFVLLATGFALALAALYVFFRDLSYIWGVGSFMLWMTSPLFYPAQVVSERVRVWFHLNPVGIELGALREVVLGAGPIDWALIGMALSAGIIACCLGSLIFVRTRSRFMDLL
jgi:lipopolysaccharide transport system permease protein